MQPSLSPAAVDAHPVSAPPPEPVRPALPDLRNSSCVWAGNVCPTLTDGEVRAAFEPFGEIIDSRRFSTSNCAFITYRTIDSARAALVLEGTTLGTMTLTLNIGQTSRHLWVGNLPEDITSQEIADIFAVYGRVESTWLMANSRVRLFLYLYFTVKFDNLVCIYCNSSRQGDACLAHVDRSALLFDLALNCNYRAALSTTTTCMMLRLHSMP